MREIKFFEKGPRHYQEHGLGERHGSLEATWVMEDETLLRVVSVSITPPPEEGLGGFANHRVEVRAGASNEGRFVSYLVASWDSIRDEDLENSDFNDEVTSILRGEAARRADNVQAADLVSSSGGDVSAEKIYLRENLGRPPMA